MTWPAGEVRRLSLAQIGQRYRRYRLQVASAEEAMVRSLQRYGQLAPIVVCLHEERAELIDGFTRLAAANQVTGMSSLQARLIQADARTAKAAIYGLNQTGRHTHELEEAWIVHALVREDGLSQIEVGQLLGRHKSWVCRRLAVIERLDERIREDLRLGLVSPSAARELVRLPQGNQEEVMVSARQASLSCLELHRMVGLVSAAPSREQVEYVLAKPREALQQEQAQGVPGWDPRLSGAGNRMARQVGMLLEQLGRMETWLERRGRADLTGMDRSLLRRGFERLSAQCGVVAELSHDLLSQLELP